MHTRDMTTTQQLADFDRISAAHVKPTVFDQFAERDEFLGFGYIGARRNALDESDPEAPALPESVTMADSAILARAAELGWTVGDLFTWANSKKGRWLGDVVFGSDDSIPAAVRKYVA